jgi:voltage-gated potassium channel Kch
MEQPDAHVIKAILALTHNPARRSRPYHVVAEINDANDLTAAKMVGGNEVALIVAGDLISRIIVQTSRQSGLSVVYTELMDFGGDEIYFQSEPALVGRTFGDALLAYEKSSVIGLRNASSVRLNPPMATVITADDQVIAISEDDDTIKLSPLVAGEVNLASRVGVTEEQIRASKQITARAERTLILGWNRRAPSILMALNDYVAPGSVATVVAGQDAGADEESLPPREGGNSTFEFRQGSTTDRRTLDELEIPTYDQVIVLPYSDTLGVQEADARTLVTLLHLREINGQSGGRLRIVTEMLDLKNRELAEVTGADDFIVSSRLTSLMLAQISENKDLAAVFEDLLDPEGSEIYLKPASSYVATGEPVNFYTVVESARRRNEIAIGYRVDSFGHDAGRSYGVVVNPAKSQAVTFTEADQIVVIAEE